MPACTIVCIRIHVCTGMQGMALAGPVYGCDSLCFTSKELQVQFYLLSELPLPRGQSHLWWNWNWKTVPLGDGPREERVLTVDSPACWKIVGGIVT